MKVDAAESTSATLSWGSSEELLVGATSLMLFQTAEDETIIWGRKLSSPVKFALFSHDSTLIASTGRYDRLVKIWRRLSFGSDDVQFYSTYLSHPRTVTDVRWRGPQSREQSKINVLYTLCVDGRMRIWAATDPHGQQALQLWTDIDLQVSIQPRILDNAIQSYHRYAFVIDSRDFNCATERAGQATAAGRKEHYAHEHIAEVARCSPDVCVVLDDMGHMSAWGIENAGCKEGARTDVFNVAHVEKFRISPPLSALTGDGFVHFLNFCSEQDGSAFTLLVHQFDGRIAWLEGRLDDMFDPSWNEERLHLKALWTGHDGPIKKIIRNVSGKALLSRTNDNEGLIWKQQSRNEGMALSRYSSLSSPEHIHRTCLLDEGDFVVNLHHQSVSLWDTHSANGQLVASCEYHIDGKSLCLLVLPNPSLHSVSTYVATISSTMNGIVWEVKLPHKFDQKIDVAGDSSPSPTIQQYCYFSLGLQDELAFVLPVDPAGSTTIVSGFLDTFAKDIALSYTHNGTLRTWTARMNTEKRSVDWLVTSTVATGIDEPSLASGSSIRKIAVVDSARNGLTVWDSRGGQLEYDKHFEAQEMIQDLDWSSTPDDQSILAVGFPHKVIVLSQMRYDYLDKGPAWASIREIYIRELTPHPIGDSTWLASGNLVIGAGNQLFVHDKAVATSDGMVMDRSLSVHKHSPLDIFSVVALLNGPLPVFHPQFLAQCILAGKIIQVQKIIVNLNKALKFYADDDELDSSMKLTADDFFTEPEVRLADLESLLTF